MAGKFIVIDGADGAGKSTQTERLIDAARSRRLSAAYIHFPSYTGTEGGKVVQQYLHGTFGDPTGIHPVLASMPYALDRFEQAKHLRELINTNDLVVADRYVISNMAFQGAKLAIDEREPFTQWCATIDYEILQNPREDAVLFLSVPTALSAALMQKRAAEVRAKDLHEENRAYQAKVLEQYHWLCSHYPHWHAIDCSEDRNGVQSLRSIESIGDEIMEIVFGKILEQAEQSQEATV